MTHEVTTETVAARTIAAVRRHARIPEIAAVWKPALDLVWAFLPHHPELRSGSNVFLYRHPHRRDEAMEIFFGVEVTRRFPEMGEVVATATPAGEVATTLHVGPYAGMVRAHDAIHAWRTAAGRDFAGWSWEVYGDWNDDERLLETRIYYLLA